MIRRKCSFFFPGLHCDLFFVPEKEGTDKCINELWRELLLKDNSAVLSWQYIKSRSYLLAAGSGKEIGAFPVRKWQNNKMLQCCDPKDDEGFLSLLKEHMNIQNPRFKCYCVMSIILWLEVLEIGGQDFFSDSASDSLRGLVASQLTSLCLILPSSRLKTVRATPLGCCEAE